MSDEILNQTDVAEKKDFSLLLTQIGRLSEAVRTEFDLVTARMGWMVTAESFIFAAFATTVANYTGKSVELLTTMRYLLLSLPALGILLAIIVYAAILAAHSATYQLKAQRDALIATLPSYLQIKLVSSKDQHHFWGNLPPVFIPPFIALIWAGVFISLFKPAWIDLILTILLSSY